MSLPPFVRKYPYLAIVALALLLFLLIGLFVKPVRVGDGSEYYAMVEAWQAGHRPWMTPAAYDAYQALVDTGGIRDMVSRAQLENAFPALRLGQTSDFNHFWFYSLLAYICIKAAGFVGLHLGVAQGFLILHGLLLTLTLSLAYRYFRLRGLIAVALMLLVSPVFWFIDKAHTEFFTVCLILSAVMLVRAERYVLAASCIALAATQNPSFALVACIPLFYRVVLQRKQAYSLSETIFLVITVLGVLVHPVYYFLRFGVPTPQLLAGGAALGANLSTFYVWIIDPDLGLLPNWPLGLLVLLVCLLTVRRPPLEARPCNRRWLGFVVLYLLINFYAHASTTNLNSGATPGLARYALWYLPLGFPLFMRVLNQFSGSASRVWFGLAVLSYLCVSSVRINDPRKPEQYSRPSKSSEFIQRRTPGLYNPPAEVFSERYSGLGDNVYVNPPRAVIGPDCKKLLVDPRDGRRDATVPAACLFDKQVVNNYVNSAQFATDVGVGRSSAPYYTKLPPAAGTRLLAVIKRGAHQANTEGDGGEILAEGWSVREQWGTWSDGTRAALMIPCNTLQYFSKASTSRLRLQLRGFNKQHIVISGSDGMLWQGAIGTNEQAVEIGLPARSCRQERHEIVFDIPDATSPARQGHSGDERMLGIGLSSWEIVSP